MHIGFFTPEYPTKNKSSGGLASYLGRIVKELKKQGHTINVFVLDITASEETSFTEDGVRIHYIPLSKRSFIRTPLLYGRAFWKKLGGLPDGPITYLLSGHALAKATRKTHQKEPFDIIHSSNLETTALFLPKQLKKISVIRVSSKRDVWDREDGYWGPRAWMVNKIEEYMIKRAPRVYASSIFLKNLHENKGANVSVIRPPLEIDTPDTAPEVSFEIPPKYFLHVAGKFGPRKGTDTLLESLALARAQCSDIAVVFVGRGSLPEEYKNDSRTYTLGPQPRPIVHFLFKNALASILPSTAETLPNTAIESIICKTPVIGTDDSSIEELVTPGENGILVPPKNPEKLAEVMVDVWKNGFTFHEVHTGTLAEMEPEIAAEKVIKFATKPVA